MNGKKKLQKSPYIIENCIDLCRGTLSALDSVLFKLKNNLKVIPNENGQITNSSLDGNQYLVHGFAWIATYIESLKQMTNWAIALDEKSSFGEIENLILQIAFGEYLSQLKGGIQMSPSEFIRITDFGLSNGELEELNCKSILNLCELGNTDDAKRTLVNFLKQNPISPVFANNGLEPEYEEIRNQFFRFSNEKVVPEAHNWHMQNLLIPTSLISELSKLGVFSLTIPEEFGGLGMSKTAMCVVSEELSRGYIGVGSLATRSEIAAELILTGGTKKQKEEWLPKIASAEIMPAAVFTEPNTGSDLGSLQTRAVLKGANYYVTGNKTWITHASRANMMTLLARTNQKSKNYAGLSIFIAPKTPGQETDLFPSDGIKGTEIEVLGYRGMKEYELNFDNFKIKKEYLLGEKEGCGFKQLMETFESARIQTAARAVGVAQNALDLALKYALERKQFGKAIIDFPRVYSKIASMTVDIMISRQLTYFSSREKDENRRCDLPAGMAKMLSAKTAWSAADNSLQIHGGNGFALEYDISRVLCDARILSIFEGAAEIQAQIIARRLLEKQNS